SDDSWLLVLHAGADEIEFTLPAERYGDDYEPVLDSASPDGKPEKPEPLDPGENVLLPSRSLLLLRARR
ncbi:hypothetical protein ACFQ1S_38960, partial [Kibdelosporangium lantanae]